MQYEMLVSLGYNCQTRFTFDKFANLGPEFVLDGVISYKLPKIIDLLKNEFSTFFLPNQIFVEGQSNSFYTVKDGLNDITSIHNFSCDLQFEDSYKETMKLMKHQYTNLMQEVKGNPGKLLFVRRNKAYETLESIVELHDTIKSLRGDLPFDLYVFQNKDWMMKEWGIPTLHTFYDGNWTLDERKGWVGNDDLWQTVFRGIQFTHAFLGRSA